MFTFVNLWEMSRHTLFEDIELPQGKYTSYDADGNPTTELITPDKDVLVNSILDEVAELQPLTIDVDVMKMKIKNFFLKNQVGFEHLISMNLIWYSPIENTDRYESRKENRATESSSQNEQSAKLVHEDIHQVSTYDSDIMRDAEGNSSTDTNTGNASASGKSKDSGDATIHAHGNIGVTTNQQMLTQELEFWNKFSFYTIVAQKFMFELCLTCETYN